MQTTEPQSQNSEIEGLAENVFDALGEWVDDVAQVAQKLESFVGWVLLLGVVCLISIGIKFYSPDAQSWWTFVSVGVLALPVLVWFIFWRIIKQLVDAPGEMADLAKDENSPLGSAMLGLRSGSYKKPKGIFSLLGSVRELRKTDGFDAVFDTVSGIALLANPLFALATIFSLLGSLGLLIITPIIWLLF